MHIGLSAYCPRIVRQSLGLACRCETRPCQATTQPVDATPPAVPPPPSTGQEPWSHAHASTITPPLRVQSSLFFHDVLRTGGEPNGRARVWWQCVGSAVQFFHPRLRPALARAPGDGYRPFCPCGSPLVLFPGVAHASLVHS